MAYWKVGENLLELLLSGEMTQEEVVRRKVMLGLCHWPTQIGLLDESWAEHIARLEAEVYPPQFRCGVEDFREDLQNAKRKGENFSFGIVDQVGELYAYLVAYVERSDRHKDNVVYVSDICVRREWENQGLVDKLVLQLLKAVRPTGMPIEGECREASWRMVKNHPRVFARYKYRLAQHKKLPKYNGGEDHWWIRLEPTK